MGVRTFLFLIIIAKFRFSKSLDAYYSGDLSNDISPEIDNKSEDTSFNYVERMVKKWAPLVWLAPNEKFFPSSIPQFLPHVTASRIKLPKMKIDDVFLVTKLDIDSLLQNSSSILYGRNPNISSIPVYARVFNCGDKHFHVTYWLFFPYSQGKTICTLNMGLLGPLPIPRFSDRCFGSWKSFGSHIGDWEHTSILFEGNEEPTEMYVSAHDAGAYYTYDPMSEAFIFSRQEIRKGFIQKPIFPGIVKLSKDETGYHPILFAAKGSHGLWTAPGEHKYVRLPRLYDTSGYGTAWRTWEKVEILHPKKNWPKWMSYSGKWGNPRSKCHPLSKMGLNICEITDGPTGIPAKKQNFACTM